MKYCTKCKETKPLIDYYHHIKKDRPNIKISSYCKKCTYKFAKKKEKVVHTKNCEYCLQEFKSVRFDARFCSDYHSVAFRKDPERKRLDKKKAKEENEKHIYNLDLTAQEVYELTGIDINYIYTLGRIASKKSGGYGFKLAPKVNKIKVPKNKFKYEDNFKVKKESKESRIEKWNKIFKEIQC